MDVRDVVKAYYDLLINGKPGDIYNICSGKGVSLSEIIDIIANIVGVKVNTEVDGDLVRPNDNKVIIGSNEKIYKYIMWRPEIPLYQTLMDMIECQL